MIYHDQPQSFLGSGEDFLVFLPYTGTLAILFNSDEQIVNASQCYYRARFGSNQPKVWEEMSKINFQDVSCGGHLGFSIKSVLAILCLLGT